MKTYRLWNFWGFTVLSVLFSFGTIAAQKPAAPKNLKVDTIIGHEVYLSWTNPDKGSVLFENSFEKADPSDLTPSFEQGWTVKSTNTSYYACSWFNFPTEDFIDAEEAGQLIHSGKKSAAVWLDPTEDDHPMHQDEWLISPTVPGAAYLTFYSFIAPNILIDGADTNFPDHFVVQVSTDNGKTWSEPLWDARYDASPKEGWQKVELSLADLPTDEMKVAFHAYGDSIFDEDGDLVNTGLFFTWIIDDVTIYKSAGTSANTLIADYKITLDGEDLASTSNEYYTDNSKKTGGEHTYSIHSVGFNGEESEPATVKVELKELVFAAPRNFTCTPTLDNATGKYTVRMTWDAPESDFQPTSYTIYNGKLLFGIDLTDKEGQEGIGMSGCFGVYQFSIVALYESPDGESEPVVRNLALGVRFGVNDLQTAISGKDVVLSWQKPYESDYTVDSYTIYRGGEKIAEGLKELSYRDVSVPDGLYQYNVIAVYEDKQESVRTSVSIQVGEPAGVSLPYSQEFATTFLPANWKIENQSQRTPDKYIWYFDDQSRLGVKGRGFEGCYAAIDCNDAPGYTRDATLELPAFDLSSVQDRSSITFSFHYSYAIGGSCNAGTEYSVDGKEWIILEMIDKGTGFTPSEDGDFHIQYATYRLGEEDAIMALIDTAKTLYLRFHYSGTMSKFFAVDNILVTADGLVSNEAGETEDVNINVSAYNGSIKIHAPQSSIKNVEVFSIQGMRLSERKGNGESFMTLPVSRRGPAIVRVTTDKGMKVAKLLL